MWWAGAPDDEAFRSCREAVALSSIGVPIEHRNRSRALLESALTAFRDMNATYVRTSSGEWRLQTPALGLATPPAVFVSSP
jgi:hypothetical protein